MPKALPTFPSIDHPCITRSGEHIYVVLDPTDKSDPPRGETFTSDVISGFIKHHRTICRTNPAARLAIEPHGYTKFATIYNSKNPGTHLFALWDESDKKYLIPAADDRVTAAQFHLPAKAKPAPAVVTEPAPPPALSVPIIEHSDLFNNMLIVAASAETNRRMLGAKYFADRKRKRVDGSQHHHSDHSYKDCPSYSKSGSTSSNKKNKHFTKKSSTAAITKEQTKAPQNDVIMSGVESTNQSSASNAAASSSASV